MKGIRPWKNVWSHLGSSEIVPCYSAAKITIDQHLVFFDCSYGAVYAGNNEGRPVFDIDLFVVRRNIFFLTMWVYGLYLKALIGNGTCRLNL